MPILIVTLCLLLGMTPLHAADAGNGVNAAAVDDFIRDMVQQGFAAGDVRRILNQAEFRNDIIDAMNRPAEAKPWHQYRKIFLTRERIDGGVKFWRSNEALIRQVSSAYGVPPEILIAIIGVETRYGGFLGRYRVLDALYTLAFGYPKRAAFFRDELKHFLVLTRDQGLNPTDPVGSYAGAMGMPQFMPSSYRSYAVDFDRDGRINLWGSIPDILGSVANYFTRHGWRSGEPVVVPVSGSGEALKPWISKELKPDIKVSRLRQMGVGVPGELGSDVEVRPLAFDLGNQDEYWLGLNNFYVISRYNHSPLYSMAVYQLGQEIRQAHDSGAANPFFN